MGNLEDNYKEIKNAVQKERQKTYKKGRDRLNQVGPLSTHLEFQKIWPN